MRYRAYPHIAQAPTMHLLSCRVFLLQCSAAVDCRKSSKHINHAKPQLAQPAMPTQPAHTHAGMWVRRRLLRSTSIALSFPQFVGCAGWLACISPPLPSPPPFL